DVLAEYADGALAPARADRRCDAARGEDQLVARAAHFAALEPGDQRLPRAGGPRPLRREAHLLRRHALAARQRFAAAVSRHRREVLVVDLRADEQPRGEGADLIRVPIRAERQLANVRVIRRQRRAVFARLVEQRGPREDAPAVFDQAVEPELKRRVVARGSRIDRAALALVYGDVAVRRERFGGDLPA